MNETVTNPVARDSGTLCLTLNRSFQQEHSSSAKVCLKGVPFAMRSRPPRFCKRTSVALFHITEGKIDSVTYRKVPCNSWRCPDCAPKVAWRTRMRIKEIIISNAMKYFLTLTLNPKIIPSEYLTPNNQTHKYITKLFNTFRTQIRRDQKDFRYVWVIEFQKKSGLAHLHIVINTRLDISKVREHWKSIGGGPQMDVSPIRDLDGMAHYISKYLTKGLTENIGFLHHFERRYSFSRNCKQPTFIKALPFYPALSSVDKRSILNQQGLNWVYNRGLIGDFVDGETIPIDNKLI